jgi:GNAT superfamily N-acetyltransferase
MQWREYTPADLETYTALRNAAMSDYMLSSAQIAKMDATLKHGTPHARWLAFEDGVLVAAFNLEPPRSGGLDGELRLGLALEPNHQHFEHAAFQRALQAARDLRASSVRVYAQEASAQHTFYSAQGFVETDRMWDSKLAVATVNLETFADDLKRVRYAGLRVITLEGRLEDAALLESYYDSTIELLQDVPATTPFVPWTFAVWRERTLTDPMFLPDAHFIGVVGEDIVAVSQLFGSARDGVLDTGLTGVRRAYRGRGFGLALKLEAIRYALANGKETIYTTNHVVNRPMLSINDRLGFKPEPARVQLRLTL